MEAAPERRQLFSRLSVACQCQLLDNDEDETGAEMNTTQTSYNEKPGIMDNKGTQTSPTQRAKEEEDGNNNNPIDQQKEATFQSRKPKRRQLPMPTEIIGVATFRPNKHHQEASQIN
jgi:hypothetical protein